MALRNQVFISYAREDENGKTPSSRCSRLRSVGAAFSLWSDGSIPAGEGWVAEVDKALGSAAAGLLLVTTHFFYSELITTVELPRLLALAKTSGVAIWWVPVGPSLYKSTPLNDIQAAWPPSRPLMV
jgi:hypothetical protein